MTATVDQLARAFPDVDRGLIECVHEEERGSINACFEQLSAFGEPVISKQTILAENDGGTKAGSPSSAQANDEGGMSRENTTVSNHGGGGGDLYDAALPQDIDEMRKRRNAVELNELMASKLKDIEKLVAEDRKFDQVAKLQKTLGPQSLRHNKINIEGESGHRGKCFRQMIARETQHCGEFVCFYHSYSFAELMYEVQATIARVVYGLPDDFSPVPRLLKKPFKGKPHIQVLLDNFSKLQGQDHDSGFREVAISVSVSLSAPGSEAPPMSVFDAGYSCNDLSFNGIMATMLTKCGCPSGQTASLIKKIADIGSKYNLDGHLYDPSAKSARSSKPGQMLQIFIRVDCVDDVAYGSHAYGVYDPARNPLSKYLLEDRAPDSQGRVFWHPTLFLDDSKVKVYHYPADESYANKGKMNLQKELFDALNPIMFDTPEKLIRCLHGIEGYL